MDNAINKGQAILDRYNRLPTWPFSYTILFILGTSFFFAFYDMVVIGFALPQIVTTFHASQFLANWSISSGLVGYVAGAFLDARLSDRFGRRLAVIVSIAFYAVGALLIATSTSMEWLIIWRFISGLGLGAEIACCVSYVSELAPSAYRGRAVAIAVAFGFVGFAITPYLALAIMPFLSWGWRILFVVGGVCGVVAFFFRSQMPQSPSWLVLQGRFAEAECIVQGAEERMKARGKTLLSARLPISSQPLLEIKGGVKNLIFSRYTISLCLFILIWFFYYVGNYGFLMLQDTLLINIGFSLARSLFMISLQSIGFVIGSLIAIYLSDRFERKFLCAIIALIWALSLFVIGYFTVKIVIVLLGFVCAITISTLVPLLYAYTSENFPTRFRATGTAIADGIGHFGAAFCGQIIFFFYNLYSIPLKSFAAAMWTMAATGLIASVILLFGRRLTNKQLEN